MKVCRVCHGIGWIDAEWYRDDGVICVTYLECVDCSCTGEITEQQDTAQVALVNRLKSALDRVVRDRRIQN